MTKPDFFQRIKKNFDISKYEFFIFIVLLVFYYVYLKYQQQWIITSMSIDMYNEGAT